MNKEQKYQNLLNSIESLIDGESDVISIMSTIACELYHNFDHFNWVGFYRLINNNLLKVGPYQGTHGCLTIKIGEGVCGKCASENKVQIENDVSRILHHIACSPTTKSEIVVPVVNNIKQLSAVLDIDSIKLDSFNLIDERYLKMICNKIYLN